MSIAPPPVVAKDNVAKILNSALDAGEGLLRLTPTWVPRSFLHPGHRIKLHPEDYYAFGADRGGIDERWFASTTEAANDNRTVEEGLSDVLHEGKRFQLRDAVSEAGDRLIGKAMHAKYKRWPVYSKFFDNMGPIPHHMHQGFEHAALTGQEGKPESYYFPPQYNNVDNNFAYTFMGLEPGTTKAQLRKCLENWHKGDNGILDLSKAYRLQRGTGWLIPPGVLHAPGSLCTYEPQWGSDVFGMFQSIVEGRYVPWSLLVKDVPANDDLVLAKGDATVFLRHPISAGLLAATAIVIVLAVGLPLLAAQFCGSMAVPDAELVQYPQGRTAAPSRGNMLTTSFIWYHYPWQEIHATLHRMTSHLTGVAVPLPLIRLTTPLTSERVLRPATETPGQHRRCTRRYRLGGAPRISGLQEVFGTRWAPSSCRIHLQGNCVRRKIVKEWLNDLPSALDFIRA